MYKLKSEFSITSEQERVAGEITANFQRGTPRQVLLGVTGSGKTFTMAHIIQRLNVPALVLSPNKTLAAQLYQEFKGFFPENRVGYFISYYDYYQPEAYIPQRHQYIAKEVSINPELERLRIDAARNLLESRHTVVVASVSSIYSIGSPDDFFNQKIAYARGSRIEREAVLREFVSLGYSRSDEMMDSGTFRVRGPIVEIFPTSEENPIRFIIEDGRIYAIEFFDPVTGAVFAQPEFVNIFPISYFFTRKDRIGHIVQQVEHELKEREAYFRERNQHEYADRIRERTMLDMELLTQYGRCPGIENYSLYLTGRSKDQPPYTLLDFFKGDYLLIMDESHITVPQLQGMYRGDRSRKETLVEFGFRLPSALENRPLNFQEVDAKMNRVLYVSATPAPFEIRDAQGHVADLLVRPTGLLDAEIEMRFSDSPVEDMLPEIRRETANGRRVLVTTLTKKMAESLTEYLMGKQIRATYMHSEIKTLDRIRIIRKLRMGEVEVLVGINLLREGLDLPEVSLVVVLDADREGFLRSETSLIQTFGRVSRNLAGRVLVYLQQMTGSLQKAVDETTRRRNYQLEYNRVHGITPMPVTKQIKDFYDDDYWLKRDDALIPEGVKSRESLQREIDRLTAQMKARAVALDFMAAAALRDRIKELKNALLELF